ncbi:TatD family hydrolase [Aestuariimicrobium kwangyangense]|uniref:TatD family hydrolase n=1 Tax=Aestuariimicrobium kwangyangense TaxID=396389 RepID=UPI0003B576B7|nr:TatD family hydrolase [Aestuariimicrobium kwangyangense]
MTTQIQSATQFEASNLPPLPEPLPRPVIDSHTHADSTEQFSGLGVALNLDLAASVGVSRIVQVGCDVASSEFAVNLAARDPRVVAAVAIHPNEAARAGDDLDAMLLRIEELASSGPHVRAVGETGLDHYRTRDEAGQGLQVNSFAGHIEIAHTYDKTLVIHDRDAHLPVLQVLDEVGVPARVVMHCFSGDATFARECLDRGAWLSFPGVVTFSSANDLRDALEVVPRDRLLVETDAPYLTPVPTRGKPNAPYLLPHTVRFIAKQWRMDLAQLCDQLTANTEAAFGGPWGTA